MKYIKWTNIIQSNYPIWWCFFVGIVLTCWNHKEHLTPPKANRKSYHLKILYSYLFKRRFTTCQPSFLGAMLAMLVSGRVPHRIHGTIVYLPMVNVGKYTSGDLIISAISDDQPIHRPPVAAATSAARSKLLRVNSTTFTPPPLPSPKKYRTSN